MTQLFLDTEFNGHGGALISMALVSPRGHEWYEVLNQTEVYTPWVQDHVIPKLGKAPISGDAFRASFKLFMRQFANPTIICDWVADIGHFCNVMAGPSYLESASFPFRTEMIITPPGEPKPENPHNALSDALALMRWYLKPTQYGLFDRPRKGIFDGVKITPLPELAGVIDYEPEPEAVCKCRHGLCSHKADTE